VLVALVRSRQRPRAHAREPQVPRSAEKELTPSCSEAVGQQGLAEDVPAEAGTQTRTPPAHPIPNINIHRVIPSLSTARAANAKRPRFPPGEQPAPFARRGVSMTREKIISSLAEAPAMNHITSRGQRRTRLSAPGETRGLAHKRERR
jgi:hypothetical protein